MKSYHVVHALAIPWSQLIHLEMRNQCLDNRFAIVLQQLVNLEQCTLYISGFDDDDELAVDGVILPRLWYLRLVYFYDTHGSWHLHNTNGDRLLNALTLPALRSLNVGEELPDGESESGIEWDCFPEAQLLTLQARSSFDLRTLSFNNTYLEATQLRDILRVTPSLVSLSASMI